MSRRSTLAPILSIVLLGSIAPPTAADWPQILGPDRNGIASSETLPSKFAEGGPSARWRRDVGEGMAGVAVAGERVVLFHRPGDVERLEALSTKDGSTLWKNDAPVRYRGGILPDGGPRSVPTIHGDTVVALGVAGGLRAVSLADGTTRWSVDLAERFGAPEGYFGIGTTPIVVEAGKSALVIVNVGADGAGVVAFDLATGEVRWKTGDYRASYSAPVLARRLAIVPTRFETVALDPATGAERWSVPFGRRGPSVVAALPLVVSDRLVLTASYGVGARALDLSSEKPKTLWSSGELASHYPTPIALDGRLYAIDGREDHGTGRLHCLDLATGKVLWTENDYGMAHLVSDGERLLVQRLDGALVLVDPNPSDYREFDRANVATGPVRALPALTDGTLYLRTTPSRGGGELIALDLR